MLCFNSKMFVASNDPLSEHIGYLSPAEIACFRRNRRFPPGIDSKSTRLANEATDTTIPLLGSTSFKFPDNFNTMSQTTKIAPAATPSPFGKWLVVICKRPLCWSCPLFGAPSNTVKVLKTTSQMPLCTHFTHRR